MTIKSVSSRGRLHGTASASSLSAEAQQQQTAHAQQRNPLLQMTVHKSNAPFATLTIELLANKTPKACELVMQSVQPQSGAVNDKARVKQGTYQNCHFKRLTDIGLQTGEVTPAARTVAFAELEAEVGATAHAVGTLSLCRSAAGFDGSQFFICLTRDETELAHLDKRYLVFGRVTEESMATLTTLVEALLPYTAEYGCLSADCPLTVLDITPTMM